MSRGSPSEAAVAGSSGDRRVASRATANAVAGTAAGGRADEASSGTDGRSMVFRGSADEPRDGDMRSRRDRPQRRS